MRRPLFVSLLSLGSVACSNPRRAELTVPRPSHGTLPLRTSVGLAHHVAESGTVRAELLANGVRFGGAIGMELSAFGRDAVSRVTPARIEERGLEVRYVRDGITEWYANDPRGLEQGFDVERRPAGEGPLAVDLAFDADAKIILDRDVAHVSRGGFAIDVRGLVASDARGRNLATHFEVVGSTLRLRIDDRDAVYPITIDPWYGAAPKKLVASAPWSGVSEAAIEGDTAVVGDPGQDGTRGAAFVFVRDASGTWIEQAKLVQPTRAIGNEFGTHVAMAANTVAISSKAGEAFLFVRSGTTWPHTTIIGSSPGRLLLGGDGTLGLADGGSVGYRGTYVLGVLGWSIYPEVSHPALTIDPATDDPIAAFDKTTAIAGYPADSTKGAGAGTATVHVWRTDSNWIRWQLEQRLFPSDAAAGQSFGCKVAVRGDVALVASGESKAIDAVYVFTRAAGVWTERAKLTNVSSSVVSGFDPTRWIGDAAVTEGGLKVVQLSAIGDVRLTDGLLSVANGAWSGGGASWTPSFALARAGTVLALSPQRVLARVGADVNVYELGAALPNGAVCAVAQQCMSGFCVDGVCCNDHCGSPTASDWPFKGTARSCFACTAALKGGGVDGVCEPIAADTDPRSSCEPDSAFPTSCKADGACDGKGACRVNAKAGAACGATTCATGTVSGLTCNGGGSCVSGTVSCAPYGCGATSCKTTCSGDDDCASSAFCAGTACTEKIANGKACTAGTQCNAGFCVDGVCCESACSGQCQSCAEAGSAGKCAAVTGAPRGTRPKCAGNSTECGGTCDGVNAASCSYASPTKVCATSCAAGRASKSTCDGAGACSTPTLTPCGAYACAGAVCGTTCIADGECTAGYACKLGACVPAPKGTCTTDRSQSQSADGVLDTCAPYLCDSGLGTCLKQCASTSDCAPAYLCESRNCVSAPPVAEDSGGCAMGNTRGESALPVVLAAMGAAVARRRRHGRVSSLSGACRRGSRW